MTAPPPSPPPRPFALPLLPCAAALCALASLAGATATGLALVHEGHPLAVALRAAGLTAAAVAAPLAGLLLLVARLSYGLRSLRRAAVTRLQDPAGPLPVGSTRMASRVGLRELAALAAVLDALHLRVRLGDQVGERHRAEAETAAVGVFELLSDLVAAEEGTRGQLAAELHDTVAQSLAIARGLLAQGPAVGADLARVTTYVEEAEEQVRAVMARTRPPALRDGDLASAVGALRDDLLQRYGLRVEVRWPRTAYPLPLASAITVYRFFQEALLNVVKHADVDAASVELVVEEHRVRATVRDEGPGFDPSAVRPERGRHVGLGLLRERARLSGGRLDVASAPGRGTVVTLLLPRPSVERAAERSLADAVM